MQKRVLVIILLIASLFAFSGCTTEEIYNIRGTESSVSFFIIRKNEWRWNSDFKRYEVVRRIPALDQFIFDDGTIVGSVFVTENNIEVQKLIPFVQTYAEGAITYTETISMDFSINPSEVCFYIQASDLSDEDKYLKDYEFKVSLFWEEF